MTYLFFIYLSGFSPCDTVTCHNDGICFDDFGVAKCECKPGFIGLDCSTDSCDHIGYLYNLILELLIGFEVLGR